MALLDPTPPPEERTLNTESVLAAAGLFVAGIAMHVCKKLIDEHWPNRSQLMSRLAYKGAPWLCLAMMAAFSTVLLWRDDPLAKIDLIFAMVLSMATATTIVFSAIMQALLSLKRIIDLPSGGPREPSQ